MTLTCVHVQVKPEHVDDFIRATRLNHLKSIEESGNLRFDIARSADDPGRFLLYEAYRSPADADAHKQTEHYLEWRKTVEPWMTQPRRGDKYQILFPEF